MANLDDVLIFIKVAQFESISRAGRSLGMPISTVSRRLSVLESKLGVSLLRRTTRRVTLTAQGREYFNQCREPLTLMEEAERAKKARIHVSGPISSHDFNSVSTFVYQGHGIGLLPSTYCDAAIAGGALVRLLPKWSSAEIPVFAVYSNRKFLPSRLNVFLNALAAWGSPLWIKD
jgi:DNA-binding transcriptional LysR family regulator